MQHPICQGEGGEEGDPLMPLLFSLVIHDSLRDVKRGMQEDDELFAFLDDVYVLSPPGRTRTAYDALAEVLPRKAGIQLHTVKTRVWNAAGVRPVNLEDLGPDVWFTGNQNLGHASWFSGVHPGGVRRTAATGEGVVGGNPLGP